MKAQANSSIDIKKLDDETEFIVDKFREGYHTMEIKQLVKNFVEHNVTQCQLLIENNQFKGCYFIYKKLEKVLCFALKNFGIEFEQQLLCFKDVVTNLSDTAKQLSPNEKTIILKHSLELAKPPLRGKDGDTNQIQQQYEFFKYLVKHTVSVLNNIGVIYVLRNKTNEGLSYFARAIFGRLYDFDSYVTLYQAALIETNISFTYKLTENYDEASHYLNKAILNLENLDKLVVQQKSHALEITISSRQLIPLLDMLYNKKDKKLLPEPREIQREKMLHLLALTYHYYSELLISLNKQQESYFCKSQYELLQQMFNKMNPRAAQVILHTPEMEKISQDEQEIVKSSLKKKTDVKKTLNNDDNFSSVSFKTAISGSMVPTSDLLSKDKIVFQKYIEINQKRFKVIVLQLNDIGCIQILLYSKPLNYLRGLVIAYQDLVEFSKQKQPDAFANEKNLEELFKTLIRKLFVQDDELHIKDIEHFQNIDEFKSFFQQVEQQQ